jgi:predicted DNA-binding transcriptional regulator YafY
MRSSRLLSILLYLQVHGRTTAAELAKRLEVSERTIYRDMDALSAAGIPVVAERGAGGGWYLLDDYRIHLTGLNEEEVRTIFLSTPGTLLADLGLQRTADDALVKLMAALPYRQRRSADFVRQRIHIDGAGWHADNAEKNAWLAALQEAVWEERKVEITYRRGDGEQVERTVEPLGLVAKGKVWYLVATVDGEYRTYRVSRLQKVQLTSQPCVRPDGFDLAEHWEMSTAQFLAGLPRYRATLRVKSEILPWLRSIWRYATIKHEEPADPEGWQIITTCCETIEEACAYILGCGPRAEVLDPPELRQKVAESVEAMRGIYGGGIE